MSSKKTIRIICIGVGTAATLIFFLLLSFIGSTPATPAKVMEYEDLIFKTDRIHRIDIRSEDWESFLTDCSEEQYLRCSVDINGEILEQVGLQVQKNSAPNNGRYSFYLEFDHYDSQQTYHQLDKLYLNNLYLDNTMMKDYLTYRLMNELGVAAPLCSYVTIYVNGRSLGLYLAVEAIEESFLERYYGSNDGALYQLNGNALQNANLQYIDDDPDSYLPIFSQAKTPVTEADTSGLIRALKQLSTGKNAKGAVDAEAVIRYFAVHNFVCNPDSTVLQNSYLYEREGKLSLLPWDYHLAYGGSTSETASAVVNRSIYDPVSDSQSRPMFCWITNSNDYTWLYRRYCIELLYVDPEPIIDQIQKMIAPYVYRDPTRFCTFEEFEAGVETLKEFLELRAESVQQQIWYKEAKVDVGDLDLSSMSAAPTGNS